jgi:hypothetical protein
MPDIKSSVGDGAVNQAHDIAMVQAMLRVVKTAKGQPYLAGNYDGAFGNQTRQAIQNFQKDHKIAAPPAPPPVKAPAGKGTPVKAPPPPPPAAPAEKYGVVSAGGPTIQKLNALLAAKQKDMMVAEGTRTIYFPGDAADAEKSAKAIENNADLHKDFRPMIAKLVRLMFERHKVVLTLTASGGRRTFQKQFDLATTPNPKTGKFPTKAGPGESNHNWGQAVDIGPNGWVWMNGNGTPVTDDWWLQKLAPIKDTTVEFWKVRDKIAFTELGQFPSALAGDFIHVQKFDDSKVNMRRSLAHLLKQVGRKFDWDHSGGSYQCDLGFGGKTHPVGTAVQIWGGNAKVEKQWLADGLTATTKKIHKAADIKEAQLKEMRQKLREEFVAAQNNWELWEAK